MEPYSHDNRVVLHWHPPDLHLGHGRDIADGPRGGITGPPGCRGSWPSRTDWATMGIGYGLRVTRKTPPNRAAGVPSLAVQHVRFVFHPFRFVPGTRYGWPARTVRLIVL